MKVLAYGEILWDIIEGQHHLGGAPFNFAAHCAQCGDEVAIVSRLGNDHLGMRAYTLAKTYGVSVALIQWDQLHPTGTVDVQLNSGQPDYEIRPHVAYDYIDTEQALKGLSGNQFDVFYFGSLAQRHEVSADTLFSILDQFSFRDIFYDVNLRKSGFSDDIVKRSLARCTIFKLNRDEVAPISEMLIGNQLSNEEFCKCVRSLYPNIRLVIITAAEQGCYVFESKLLHSPAVPVVVRDAVGAGDAFSASFMHTYGQHGEALEAASVANRVGAFVATCSGAIPAYSAEIKSILKVNSDLLTKASQNVL